MGRDNLGHCGEHGWSLVGGGKDHLGILRLVVARYEENETHTHTSMPGYQPV